MHPGCVTHPYTETLPTCPFVCFSYLAVTPLPAECIPWEGSMGYC